MKIREATYKDLEDIKTLCIRNGLRVTKINEEVWKNHPSINDFVDVPIGWVLENESKKIVGVYLSLFMTYQLNGKNYKASIVNSWAVDYDYRKGSLNLFNCWHNQKNIDILVDNRRSERSARILSAFKFKNLPAKDFQNVMYWVFDYSHFFKSIIKKKTKLSPGLLVLVPALFFKIFDLFFRGNKIFKPKQNAVEFMLFDKMFDAFWHALPKTNQFISERNSASLKWHFERLIKSKRATILTLSKDNVLNGYIIIMRSDNPSIGLKRFKVVDLQVLPNNEDLILDLLINAIAYSKKQNIHVLELSGFGARVRNQALKTKPFIRKLSYSPFFYKLISQDLKTAFTEKVKWEASLYDGDTSLGAID